MQNQEYELLITALGAGGDGIAEINGEKVFIPLTLPQDKICVTHENGFFELKEIISPSPDRVTPPCPYFGECGGCALQHFAQDKMLNWKRETLEKTLSMRGIEIKPEPIKATPIATRRRVDWVFAKKGNKSLLGFNATKSHYLVAHKECLLLHPELNAIIPALNELISGLNNEIKTVSKKKAKANAKPQKVREIKGEFKATITASGLDVLMVCNLPLELDLRLDLVEFAQRNKLARLAYSENGKLYEPIIEAAPPLVDFSGVEVAISPTSFLQPSKEGENLLVEAVVNAAQGGENAVDLFSGLGVFAFALAQAGLEVKAYDAGKEMIDALNVAAAKRMVNKVKGEARDLFRRPLMNEEFAGIDTVVLDPPRAGAEEQCEEIAKLEQKPKRIIMVSCNPATFARDAKILIDSGYQLKKLGAFDQFNFSAHLEVMGLFLI